MSDSSTRFGFSAFAETWNGQLAMLSFVFGLSTEVLTDQGILLPTAALISTRIPTH